MSDRQENFSSPDDQGSSVNLEKFISASLIQKKYPVLEVAFHELAKGLAKKIHTLIADLDLEIKLQDVRCDFVQSYFEPLLKPPLMCGEFPFNLLKEKEFLLFRAILYMPLYV